VSGAWLQRFQPRPQAKVRLICFPYAGAGASVFRLWSHGLPPELEVVAVQLPGREGRLREPALTCVAAIVGALLPALLPCLDRPFALFGHSMGATVAREVVRALQSGGGPMPEHLFVSARRAPQLPDPYPPVSHLPDHELVEELNRRYGGIPAEVLQHAELMALLLPSLRADLSALETFAVLPGTALNVPLTVLGGTEDARTPLEHLEAWRDETTGAFRLRMFPGDHFYLNARRDELLAELSATLAPLLRTARSREALV
jgi:surfactin synthase thioesterase subunit